MKYKNENKQTEKTNRKLRKKKLVFVKTNKRDSPLDRSREKEREREKEHKSPTSGEKMAF